MPFRYLGERILPVENMPGGDIHGLSDVVLTEHFLRQLGWRPPNAYEPSESHAGDCERKR